MICKKTAGWLRAEQNCKEIADWLNGVVHGCLGNTAGFVLFQDKPPDSKDLPTPSSTPTQSRKNRRRSNLFTVSCALLCVNRDSHDQHDLTETSKIPLELCFDSNIAFLILTFYV